MNFGQRFDPLAHAWHVANRKVTAARLASNAVALAAAQQELKDARVALAQRTKEQQEKRKRNKELRAQGIDPNKKPEGMSSEEFDRAAKTLRAAIQPQFPEYKKQIFLVLFNRVDRLFEQLDKHNGDAMAASIGEGKTWELVVRKHGSSLRDYQDADWARQRYAELCRWTVSNKAGNKEENKDFRTRKPVDVIEAALMTEAHAITERDFDSYCQKLAGKIAAPVERAVVRGSLWLSSSLTAHIEAGFWNESSRQPSQCWTTKMILNTSVLGKLFNQWPTRRIA